MNFLRRETGIPAAQSKYFRSITSSSELLFLLSVVGDDEVAFKDLSVFCLFPPFTDTDDSLLWLILSREEEEDADDDEKEEEEEEEEEMYSKDKLILSPGS